MSHSWRTCLTAAFIVLAGWASARADQITPDSIASPPAVSLAIQGSSVVAGGWATDQYQGLGVVFPGKMTGVDTGLGTAVVMVNGAKVWTGASYADGGILSYIGFNGEVGVSADLVTPGSTTPAVMDHLRVGYRSLGQGIAYLAAYDLQGHLIQATSAPITGGVDATLSLNVAGIHSLYATVFQAVVDPPAGADAFAAGQPDAWGVRSIEFREAPEPAGLALGGLGLCGWIAFAWRRRLRGVCLLTVEASPRPH